MFTNWKQTAVFKLTIIVQEDNSSLCFFVVESQCDLKLLTAPDAYIAISARWLSPPDICMDGYSLSAWPEYCLPVIKGTRSFWKAILYLFFIVIVLEYTIISGSVWFRWGGRFKVGGYLLTVAPISYLWQQQSASAGSDLTENLFTITFPSIWPHSESPWVNQTLIILKNQHVSSLHLITYINNMYQHTFRHPHHT